MIFKSAVDWWFYAIIVISVLLGMLSLWSIVQIGGNTSIFLGTGTLSLTLGFPIRLLLSTEYRVDSNTLLIRSGPFRWTVPIQEIHSVEPSRSILSAPALSLDRFKITHSSSKQILVSPKRRDQYKGIEALAVTEHPDFDPAAYAIQPPFTTIFNDYVRRNLGIETDLNYEILSWTVNQAWQWENGELPTTVADLRDAIAKNPFMKVFVAQGYYDSATPHFATDYTLSHMNLNPTLRDNIQIKCYEAGHMFYLDEGCLAAFKADIDNFLATGWVQA